MASLNYNRFKSTTVFGNFYNSDISGTVADAIFDRNLTVKGNTKCNNYITSSDLPTPSTSLIPSSYSTFYSNGGIPYFSYNNGTTITTIVLASVSQLSSYLTTALASSTYQTISNMLNYLTTSLASSTYQTIANMSNYIQQGGNINLNNNAKLSFPSSYPSTAVNNNNSGIGFYWNNSNQFGETDLLCYGRTAKGGLTISTAGNTTIPFTIAAFLRDYITFFYAPQHPTDTTVGDISATTQYVDDRLLPYINTPQKPTWYISTRNGGNAYTPAGSNLGSSNNSSSSRFNKVVIYGGTAAMESNWDIPNAIFTASVSGTYLFQLCVFINGVTTTGRFLKAQGTCIPGGSQYLSFNQSYLTSDSGSFTISLTYYMNTNQTFYIRCEDQSPEFYYDDGHTTLQIIKIA